MKIWLDDVRPAPKGYTWAKTYDEAIELIQPGCKFAEIEEISFDHDLGDVPSIHVWDHPTGYTLARWIERMAHGGLIGPLKWRIHSANPVGRANIEYAMKGAEKAWAKEIEVKLTKSELDQIILALSSQTREYGADTTLVDKLRAI